MARAWGIRAMKSWAAQAVQLFVLFAGTCVSAAGTDDATLDSALIQTSGRPSVAAGRFYGYRTATEGPGETAFADAQALARAEGVPLVIVWSNKGCAHCAAFARELNANAAAVTNWLTETRAVFAYFKDVGGTYGPTADSPRACREAYAFAAQTCKAQPSWPLFAFWHERADGTAVTWGGALDTTGATRTFAKLKSAFAAWAEANDVFYKGGRFAATGTGSDRYEAEAATPAVAVELVRDAVDAARAATNTLDVIWPADVLPTGASEAGVLRDGALGNGVLRDGAASPSEYTVVWQPGETARRVVVDLAQATRQRFPVGESLALILRDAQGGIVASNAVHFVADEISAGCPLWKTDRTAETLDFGEWTADYETALAKAAASAEDAYVLVSVQGSLWCPDCMNTEANFLDLEDDTRANRFRAWAKANRIALVAVDIPNYNGPSVTNRARATLFTREASAAGDGTWRSGRAYLSRKAISDTDAEATLVESHRLVSSNTAQGGFHRPEDRNAYRTGVPIFVLVRKDGTVAGRFTRFASVSPREADRVHFNAYVRRIVELVALDREKAEIENNHWSTTTETLPAGASAQGTLCSADASDAFRIAGAAKGAQMHLALIGPADGVARRTTLSVLSASDGAARTLATAAGDMASLSLDVTLDAAEAWYVVVGHDDEAAGFQTTAPGSTVAAYALRCDLVLRADDAEQTVAPPNGTALLRVERGAIYRIVGAAIPIDGLANVGGDLYRASADGVARLALDEGHSEIAYQRWRPGAIAFASSAERAIEYAGTGTVSVVRTGGASGEARVTVRRAAGEDDGGRVAWTDRTLVWADGESGVRTAGFAIRADEIAQGETTLSLHLESAANSLATLDAPTNCVVTVVDTDAPCLERLSYDLDASGNVACAIPLRTINVRDGDVSVRIARAAGSGTLPSGLKIRYDEASGEAVLEGVPTRPGTYAFTCVVSAKRDGQTTMGFETAFRVVVRDPAETNPFLVVKRPNQKLPLEAEENGLVRVVGYVDFAVTANGRISARCTGMGTRRPSFAGNWQGLGDDGTARTTLVASGGETLDVSMDADGRVALTVSAFERGVLSDAHELTAAAEWPATDDASRLAPFKGLYNVALEAPSVDEPNGYVALRMTGAGAMRTGTVRYAGVLPDGSTVSGSTTLGRVDADGAVAHLFARTSRSIMGAILRIDSHGTDNWESAEGVPGEDRLVRELVNAERGTAAYVQSRKTEDGPAFYGVYGSYFEAKVSPLRFEAFYDDAARFDAGYALEFAADAAPAFTPPLGRIEARTATFALSPRPAGLSFAYSRQTGVFCGNVRVKFANGRTATGRYRGLVVPGWVLPCECGLVAPEKPFGTGVMILKGETFPVVLRRNPMAE